MPRFQFSLRSALCITALIALVMAALRVVPREFLPPVGALGCVIAAIGVTLLGLDQPDGNIRGAMRLCGIAICLFGFVAAVVAIEWSVILSARLTPAG